MIKLIAMIVFCSTMGIHMINGYKCYVCDSAPCQHPASGDIKDCSETGQDGLSGQSFVNGAFGKASGDPYTEISQEFAKNVGAVALNDSIVTWAQVTEWVNIFFIWIINSNEFRDVTRQKINVVVV